MPELLEIEYYRRLAESRALGRRVARADAPDGWYLKQGLTADVVSGALVGRCFVAARRIGKRLLLDTDRFGPTVGLRFGMTGQLLVDGFMGIDELVYSSARAEPAWDRFAVVFSDGGDLWIRDPRRLGGVELDPDESRLGVDAAAVTLRQLTAALDGGRGPLKARLMDQSRLAGLGNLLTDEVLWRAGLDPLRPAGSLSDDERRRLHRSLRHMVRDLLARGGSHLGHLQPQRSREGVCPRDGTPLSRRTVAGRTTYSCPAHQR